MLHKKYVEKSKLKKYRQTWCLHYIFLGKLYSLKTQAKTFFLRLQEKTTPAPRLFQGRREKP